MVDIVIIGAGTAGLCAAIYGRRAGKTVLVMESGVYGGQIVNSPRVENYPGISSVSGADFAMTLYHQATELGAETEMLAAGSIRPEPGHFLVSAGGKAILARSIILAAGTNHRPLGLAREQQLTGRGISYCAACDGAFYRQKTAAVVGGGNTALEDAAFLTDLCRKVYLIHRRDTFRGEDALVRILKQRPNLEMVLDSTVTALNGTDRLTGIEVTHVRTGVVRSIPLDGLFVAIGQMPQNRPFSPPVALDPAGYIIAGEDCKTNVPGIFAAGDCRTKNVRQLSTAAGDGTIAALAACDYLLKLQPPASQSP